jgi:hypothetical protein
MATKVRVGRNAKRGLFELQIRSSRALDAKKLEIIIGRLKGCTND